MIRRMNSLVVVVLVLSCCILVADAGDSTSCDIPEGSFNGMIFQINKDEPYYGDRCPVESDYVQLMVSKCRSKYCCSQPCTCNSTGLLDQNTCPDKTSAINIFCFLLAMDVELVRYKCCDGSVEDRFHVCTKTISCDVNNGGCADGQLCRHNDTSGYDYCDCAVGYNMTLVDSNGTTECLDINECKTNNGNCSDICVNTDGSYRCTCSGNRTLDNDGHTCLYPPLPVQDTTSPPPPAFPFPYIIAIVVGAVLLLLLLLLLLWLLCRRRRRRRAAAYANDDYGVKGGVGKKVIDDDEFIVIGDKKVKKSEAMKGGMNRNENEYADSPKRTMNTIRQLPPEPPVITAAESTSHYETIPSGTEPLTHINSAHPVSTHAATAGASASSTYEAIGGEKFVDDYDVKGASPPASLTQQPAVQNQYSDLPPTGAPATKPMPPKAETYANNGDVKFRQYTDDGSYAEIKDI